MKIKINEVVLHCIFIWSLWFKCLSALLEIALGFFALQGDKMFTWLQYLARYQLIVDPDNLFAPYMLKWIHGITNHTALFLALYLLSHGIVKLFLVIGLLRKKLNIYPVAIGVFMIFIAYQIYRYTFTHSIFLTILDIFLIWLTWHEYCYYKKCAPCK
jgi:uncharacterized membrane protein